jgi:nucleoside-diphosphate-sugar epimerase
MHIVVTGANGFIGRPLVNRLARLGHQVVALDRTVEPCPGVEVVVGDIADLAVLGHAFAGGCDAAVHLATIPGGAAEADPAGARRVNIEATMALSEAAAAAGRRPRFVFASSIAVFGNALPPIVDDDTPLRPHLVYGAHKAMIEQWLATLSRRHALDALSLRFPGIVARPPAPSGMKSAFMSDVFHAVRGQRAFTSPVAAEATFWLMSLDAVLAAITHALTLDAALPEDRTVTLPALRLRMDELVTTIARHAGTDPALVDYAPDHDLQASFGAYPPLIAARGEALGFRPDGSPDALVATALDTIAKQEISG